MKAITLHQPWATLIALGAKQYETRSWSTSYRGPLAIHAGKSQEALEDLAAYYQRERETQQSLESWLDRVPPSSTIALAHYFRLVMRQNHKVPFKLGELPCGAFVALVDLVDIVPTDDLLNLSPQEIAFGNFSEGRFAWKLDHVRVTAAPIRARGYQGLWDCTEDLERYCKRGDIDAE